MKTLARFAAQAIFLSILFHGFESLGADKKFPFTPAAKPQAKTPPAAPATVGAMRQTVSAAERFYWARVKFKAHSNQGGQWDGDPFGDVFFLRTLRERTNIQVDEDWYAADLNKIDELVKFPILFMTSDPGFTLPENQLANLKEYLERGGFIFADDCVWNERNPPGDYFFKSYQALIEKMFNTAMVKLPDDHEIYHCLYDMPNGLPHMQGTPHGGWALFLNGRMVTFLSPSDLHCGWSSHHLLITGGRPWFPKEKSDLALKMGINIIVYAMTH